MLARKDGVRYSDGLEMIPYLGSFLSEFDEPLSFSLGNFTYTNLVCPQDGGVEYSSQLCLTPVFDEEHAEAVLDYTGLDGQEGLTPLASDVQTITEEFLVTGGNVFQICIIDKTTNQITFYSFTVTCSLSKANMMRYARIKPSHRQLAEYPICKPSMEGVAYDTLVNEGANCCINKQVKLSTTNMQAT